MCADVIRRRRKYAAPMAKRVPLQNAALGRNPGSKGTRMVSAMSKPDGHLRPTLAAAKTGGFLVTGAAAAMAAFNPSHSLAVPIPPTLPLMAGTDGIHWCQFQEKGVDIDEKSRIG